MDDNIITQLSIFVNNEPGRLAHIASVLKDCGINMRAFNLAESTEFGILRAIVEDPEAAFEKLKSTGIIVKKTDVIGVVIEDTPGSLFQAADIMGKAVSVFCGKDMRFEDLDGAFAELGRICKEQRVVISFDEYPYLAESISDVSAKLKGFIDDAIDHSESMMIICGSSISAMKSELDDSSKPLYGRFTLSLDLKPMTFGECREFHPGMSDEDMLMLYLTLGGSPMYHSMADKSTYRECIESLFLGRLPRLGDELDSIVRREFKPAWKHSAVLDAIGYRQATLADISSGTGLEPPMCLTYLRNLMAADIVEIVEPMLGAPRGPTYRISDDLVAFGTSVMLSGATRMADASAAYNEIYPDLRTFLGARFERFCETFMKDIG